MRVLFRSAMLITMIASVIAAAVLFAFPQALFPNSSVNGMDRLLPLIILAVAGSDVALAACAYRYDIAATVRARSIVEPWTISIAAFGFSFYSLPDGLTLSYLSSLVLARVASIFPL